MRRSILLAVFVLATVYATATVADDETTWLGVQLGRAGESATEGVPVYRVIEGSPADKAGLRAQDRITGVDGEAVRSNRELIERVQAHDAGSWVALNVTRGDEERDLRVRLSTRPETRAMKPRTGWIGLQAIALPSELRVHFGAPEDAGVMISKIDEGSPAESAGFELGDVVYEMNGDPVKHPVELYRMIAGAGVGNEAEFRLTRSGLEVELEAIVDREPESESQP